MNQIISAEDLRVLRAKGPIFQFLTQIDLNQLIWKDYLSKSIYNLTDTEINEVRENLKQKGYYTKIYIESYINITPSIYKPQKSLAISLDSDSLPSDIEDPSQIKMGQVQIPEQIQTVIEPTNSGYTFNDLFDMNLSMPYF